MILVFIIILFFLIRLIRLDEVDSNNWNEALSILGVLLPLFLLGFFIGLGLLLKSQYFELLRFRLRFLCPRVFYEGALRVVFIVELVTTLALLVYFSDKQIRLEICFGLGIDRFFDYFCPAV